MKLNRRLPEVNQGYILNLNKSTTTKIIYMYDLLRVNSYLPEKKNVNENAINFGTYSEITCDENDILKKQQKGGKDKCTDTQAATDKRTGKRK